MVLGVAGFGDHAHGVDKVPPGASRWRRRAAFVESPAIFELAMPIKAEEIRRADGVIGARHRLALIVEVGKRKVMLMRKALHIRKGIVGMGRRVVGTDRGKADALVH